jgi:secondary thiamine-phosphate synthase enzyme
MLKELSVRTSKRNELVNITRQVEEIVSESRVKNGLCVVYCPHTTAGIIVNENADPAVCSDLLNALEELVPKINFRHSEGNSDAHFKSMIVGKEKTLIIHEGELVLGTWDGLFFAEFDGPRDRKAIVKIVQA